MPCVFTAMKSVAVTQKLNPLKKNVIVIRDGNCSSFHGAGQDFDVTEFEVLGVDQCGSKDSVAQVVLPSESESTPSPVPLTPQPSLPSTPSPPPTPPVPEQPKEVGKEVQTTMSSPQLRLIKRKAPEVL